MVSSANIVLGSSIRSQLIAIKRTQLNVDTTQLRLATGQNVTSALDNPQNFFASQKLKNRSEDLLRLLDGMSQNLQAIKVASEAIEAIESILNQAEALMIDLELDLTKNQNTSLSEIILEDQPDAYWRLNEDDNEKKQC